MSKIPDLNDLIEKLKQLDKDIKSVSKDMNNMREYYKHQSTDLDDMSESAIINFTYLNEVEFVIQDLEDIQNHMEEE